MEKIYKTLNWFFFLCMMLLFITSISLEFYETKAVFYNGIITIISFLMAMLFGSRVLKLK